MKRLFLWMPAVAFLSACQSDDVEYYPIEKHHLGETYASYTMNNILLTGTEEEPSVVLNFYPEEVTDLSYIDYDEATCVFVFHRGETADYLISWAYETEGNYVEVQYGQNGMWYTVNAQKHEGEYLLRANDGMAVRMLMRANGYGTYDEHGNVEYAAGVTVNDFRIEEIEHR